MALEEERKRKLETEQLHKARHTNPCAAAHCLVR